MTSDIELYFHIPFCVRKCYYCDFLSAPADERTRAAYMEALKRETVWRAAEYAGRRISSIFIGGGTPSVLEGEQLAALLREVRAHYDVTGDAEVTVEANPGTVDPAKLEAYRGAGVNRLSIGLQSADDQELAAIGRIHDWRQFLDTYGAAVHAGFDNINVDVMSALPGQTCESYAATLRKILELKPMPTHISAYSLILEEGTALWDQLQADGSALSGEEAHQRRNESSRCAGALARSGEEACLQSDGGSQCAGVLARSDEEARLQSGGGSQCAGVLVLPDEEADREMYRLTKELLGQAGYQRYEISNYARPGYECRHNCGYWRRKNYAGFGLGAASLIDNVRFQNGRNLQDYMQNPLNYRENRQILGIREQMEEFMFLGLRMTEGVSLQDFAACFGESMETVYGAVIECCRADGLLEWKEGASPRRLTLTERGLDLANYAMAQFLV